MDTAEATTNKIKAARLRAGLTQEALARLAGISRQSLSYAETGAHRPQPATVKKLAKALGVPVDEITPPSEDPAEHARVVIRGVLAEVEEGTLTAHDGMRVLRDAGVLWIRERPRGEPRPPKAQSGAKV